jgi:hypothetical protein
MAKKSGDTRSGMGWTLVSQNVAIGVAIVILGWLAFMLGLHQLPLVGVLFGNFAPLAFVVVMTYFRSGQRTKGQAIAEGVFAGCIFLVVMILVSALFSFFTPAT